MPKRLNNDMRKLMKLYALCSFRCGAEMNAVSMGGFEIKYLTSLFAYEA